MIWASATNWNYSRDDEILAVRRHRVTVGILCIYAESGQLVECRGIKNESLDLRPETLATIERELGIEFEPVTEFDAGMDERIEHLGFGSSVAVIGRRLDRIKMSVWYALFTIFLLRLQFRSRSSGL